MSRQVAARIAGSLFVLADAAGIGGKILLDRRNDSGYLLAAAGDAGLIVTGALLVFVMALAVAMIPVVLFPVFRKQNETLALGYVVLRGIEAVLLSFSALAPLLLLTLSRQAAQAGTRSAAGLQPVADLLTDDDYWAGTLGQVAWSLSVIVLMVLLLRSRAVPRFIPLWGLAGAPLYLASQLLILYGAPALFDGPVEVITAQLALNELVLTIWILTRGLHPERALHDR